MHNIPRLVYDDVRNGCLLVQGRRLRLQATLVLVLARVSGDDVGKCIRIRMRVRMRQRAAQIDLSVGSWVGGRRYM